MRDYLASEGYRLVWVRSGEEALVELDRHPVRLVVLDIGLPGIDGFEVCRRIRVRAAVPIVMLIAREFDLLAFFLDNPGIALSRERLLDCVWSLEFPGGTRAVDQYVAQLRAKLGRPEIIETVFGVGYKAVRS